MVYYTGNSVSLLHLAARLLDPAARFFSLNIVTRLYPAPVLSNLQSVWFWCTCDLSRLTLSKSSGLIFAMCWESLSCAAEFARPNSNSKISMPSSNSLSAPIAGPWAISSNTASFADMIPSINSPEPFVLLASSVQIEIVPQDVEKPSASGWPIKSNTSSSPPKACGSFSVPLSVRGINYRLFRKLNCGLSDSSAYHIWRRFRTSLTTIRTALSGLCEPPSIESDCPAKFTLVHLQQAFKEHSRSPIAAFAATLKRFFI